MKKQTLLLTISLSLFFKGSNVFATDLAAAKSKDNTNKADSSVVGAKTAGAATALVGSAVSVAGAHSYVNQAQTANIANYHLNIYKNNQPTPSFPSPVSGNLETVNPFWNSPVAEGEIFVAVGRDHSMVEKRMAELRNEETDLRNKNIALGEKIKNSSKSETDALVRELNVRNQGEIQQMAKNTTRLQEIRKEMIDIKKNGVLTAKAIQVKKSDLHLQPSQMANQFEKFPGFIPDPKEIKRISKIPALLDKTTFTSLDSQRTKALAGTFAGIAISMVSGYAVYTALDSSKEKQQSTEAGLIPFDAKNKNSPASLVPDFNGLKLEKSLAVNPKKNWDNLLPEDLDKSHKSKPTTQSVSIAGAAK